MTPIKIDARGLKCPEPIMMLHQAIQKAGDGALLYFEATDPSTVRDVDHFCRFLGHTLVEHTKDNDAFYFTIEKAPQSHSISPKA